MRGHLVVLAAVIVAACVAEVHTQCLSDNDVAPRNIQLDLSGMADFSLDLYRQLDPTESTKNIFFSPYSIWSALNLAYFGSAGNTENQLKEVLRVTDKMTTLRLLNTLKMIAKQRDTPTAKFTYKDANRIYIHKNLPLRQCIRGLLHDLIQDVNFLKTVESAGLINDFISRTTEGKLSNVVAPNDLQDALMVLVNAAYFNGTWAHQFRARDTRPRNFRTTPSAAPVQVPMMRQEGLMRYGESSELGAQILELPYSGDVISMFLLLPMTEGIAGWRQMVKAQALRSTTLHRALSRATTIKANIELLLPKFKMETTLNKELMQGLERMGITDLFNATHSDLSRFMLSPPLYISKTIHKALVEVSEEGTEAAAATVIIAVTRSGHSRRPPAKPFHCNRPFMFLIMDNQTKNLLFMGAYKSPSREEDGERES